MTHELMHYLRCPACKQSTLRDESTGKDRIVCATCGAAYATTDGVLDFLPPAVSDGASLTPDEAQAQYWDEEQEVCRPYDHVVPLGFARQRAEYIKKRVPLDEVASAVDIGAGNGMSTHCFEDDIETIFALDRSRRLLLSSPAQVRVRADAYSLPFQDKSVELVYSWELLHHVVRPSAVLKEMARISRRYVYFFEPNRYNPGIFAFALLSKPDRMCFRNTPGFFRRQVAEAGLEVLLHDTVGWVTPNVPPVWLYKILRPMPFRVPLVGLSHFFLLRCPGSSAA